MYGIVHGRFQPLHRDHIERLLLPGAARCDVLIVGITNPSRELTAFDASNPHRSASESNPFSYWERFEMIRDALLEAGISRDRFEIVPFPINFPDQVGNYVPEGTHFITLYDAWTRSKCDCLRELGYTVEVLEDEPEKIGISATEVRKRLQENSDWHALVTPAVEKLIRKHPFYINNN